MDASIRAEWLVLLALLLAIPPGCGDDGATQDAAAQASPAAAPFQGTWSTTFQGTPSELRLEQSGANVSGTIDEALLSGTADGDTARGEVRDPQTNQVGGAFVMQRRGADIELQLTIRDPDSGQTFELPAFTYKPGASAAAGGTSATGDGSLDPQLVGRWRNTETYVSGDFSAATDTWLILNPDGTYEYGHGKTGAGGSAGSVVSGRGDADTGKWRSHDRHLQYQESGAGPWQTFGRYYVENDTMMITYPNGNKKIWHRR